ncbi:MAG: endonuclease domain-containing protein [Balneolaceae bacterium]|jgi:very-short-patch-repair endonuclease
MKKRSHYNRRNKPLARSLHNNSTRAEIRLWDKILKGHRFYGYQFNRQYPLDAYIVDFICRKLKLIIEIDGEASHRHKGQSDQDRQRRLEKKGYRVERFSEVEVIRDLNNVIRVLEHYVPESGQSP